MSTVIDYDELLCSKSVCMSSSLLLPGKTCLNKVLINTSNRKTIY